MEIKILKRRDDERANGSFKGKLGGGAENFRT